MSKPAKLLAHRRRPVPPRRSCAHGAWSRRDERPITRDVSLRRLSRIAGESGESVRRERAARACGESGESGSVRTFFYCYQAAELAGIE